MKLHILAHEKRRAALIAALDNNGTIEMSDKVWRGDAGDLIIGEVPQDEDAGGYKYAGTVRDYV